LADKADKRVSERGLRGRQGNRSEDFDPAGMTQEELIETVVRLPDGREKRFGDFTQEDLELCAEFQRKRAEARGG
jgi:hypothetical protein